MTSASFVPAYNANGLVNAVPYVCAARPGMLTTEDLPHILPRGPRSVRRWTETSHDRAGADGRFHSER